MTIYVDELRDYGKKGKWCHMWSDGPISELHEMADRIEMKRDWFQNEPSHPHYDLRASKRRLALENGAVAISSAEMVRKIRAKRIAMRQAQQSPMPAFSVKKRMRHLGQVLEDSPVCPGYGGGKWAFYSVHCCWWTSFPDDLGALPPMRYDHEIGKIAPNPYGPGLPCCPHCGSVLMQAPLQKFIESARANPDFYGKFGLDAFLEAHSRNTDTCHAGWDAYNDDIWRRFHPQEPRTYA